MDIETERIFCVLFLFWFYAVLTVTGIIVFVSERIHARRLHAARAISD